MIFYSPNRIQSQTLPVLWQIGQPITYPNYAKLLYFLVTPHLNGQAQTPIRVGFQTIDPYDPSRTDAFAEVDVQGLVNTWFNQVGNISGTIDANHKGYTQRWASDMWVEIYLNIQYYYDNGGVITNDLSVEEETIINVVYQTNVQQQEYAQLRPYLTNVGMQPLSYKQYPTDADFFKNYAPVYDNKRMGFFLSFFWDGGFGTPAFTAALRDSAGNFYGLGTKVLDAPVSFQNMQMVSVAPENLRAVPALDWTATAGGFLTNLATPNGWDRVRIMVSIAIPMGGGAYLYIPLFHLFYQVDFDTAEGDTDTVPLYWKNPLGGFETERISYLKDVEKTAAITSDTNTQPLAYNPRLSPIDARFNRSIGRNKRTDVRVSSEYAINFPFSGERKGYQSAVGIAQTKEVYTDVRMLGEYAPPRPFGDPYPFDFLYPLLAKDMSGITYKTNGIQFIRLLFELSNPYSTL